MVKKRLGFLVALALILSMTAVLSYSAASTTKANLQTIKGILIDQDCSGVKDPAKHTKECNLMPECKKSGYGIDVKQKDGTYKFYKFDATGQKLAKEYLAKTKKKSNLTITVAGTIKGNTITVSTLAEDNTAGNTAVAKQLQEYTGWIIDADCVGMNPKNHSKGCNIMGSCYDSGLGVLVYDSKTALTGYTSDNFLVFDGESKLLVKTFLNSLPDSWGKNITVKVTGTKVNGIPVSDGKIPETDSKKITGYVSGIHISSIEAAYIDKVSTNALPKPNVKVNAAK